MDKSIKCLVNKKNKLKSHNDKDLVLKGEIFIKWLKELNFEPKLKYRQDNLYMASYLYWITRIERRTALERVLEHYNILNKENSKRVFKYLYKRLEHSLYALVVKNRNNIKNIRVAKKDWMIFDIEGINYSFLGSYKMLKSLNIDLNSVKNIRKTAYNTKVFLTAIESIEGQEL